MPRFDATEVLARPSIAVAADDLWDDVLRVSEPVHYTRTRTVMRRSFHWLVPALVTLVIAATGLSGPGLWTDELATWGMSRTPWAEFWPVLRYVDAVLAPYYVLMHVWVSVFGDSDVALRAPSALAMAASAGLIGALGARLAGRMSGLLAGLVFAVLPATSRFGAEARPYALAVLVAVAATFLFVKACERPVWWRWCGYAALIAVLGWLHVVGLLLLAAHGWVLLVWYRPLWWRFGAAAVVAIAANAPLLVYGSMQRNQVSYIPDVTVASVGQYADVALGGGAVALLVVSLALFSLPLRHPSAVFTAWAVLPIAALVAVSLVLPMFLPRYLLYTAPAWALLAGTALARLSKPWMVAAIAVLVGLSLPAHLQIRHDDGHQQATETFAAIVAAQWQPGDAIVYADDEPTGSWTARDTIAHYVPAGRRPADVLATNPPRHAGLLLATETQDVTGALGLTQRLWVLRVQRPGDPLADLGEGKENALRDQFDVRYVWRSTGLTLALLQRKTAR